VIDTARVAVALQGLFEGLGLASFVKTSGSKGLQVYVPLNVEDVDFAATHQTFSKAVAELFEQNEPERVVSRQTRARRGGKVLIDWSQNDRNKTDRVRLLIARAAAAHGLHAAGLGGVRAALDKGDPALLTFEAPQVLERVAEQGDLFAPVLSLVQRLPDF